LPALLAERLVNPSEASSSLPAAGHGFACDGSFPGVEIGQQGQQRSIFSKAQLGARSAASADCSQRFWPVVCSVVLLGVWIGRTRTVVDEGQMVVQGTDRRMSEGSISFCTRLLCRLWRR